MAGINCGQCRNFFNSFNDRVAKSKCLISNDSTVHPHTCSHFSDKESISEKTILSNHLNNFMELLTKHLENNVNISFPEQSDE